MQINENTGQGEYTVIFGGSFDPPHIGHIRIAEAIISELAPTRLVIIPAGVPPHKKLSGGAGAQDRLEMTRLAFAHLSPTADISDIELSELSEPNLNKTSYTFNTILKLRGIYPDSRLGLYIGSDMFESFETWYRYEKIFAMCGIITASREKADPLFEEKLVEYRIKYSASITVLPVSPLVVSSTKLRASLAGSRRQMPEYLTKPVYDYIIKKGLYIQ